jgi:hypothetical protein
MGASLLLDYLVRFLSARLTYASTPTSVLGVRVPRPSVQPAIGGVIWTFGAALCFVVAAWIVEDLDPATDVGAAAEPDQDGGAVGEAERVGAARA